MFWDDLVEQYSFEEFHRIVSTYRNIDKDIAYRWACLYQDKMNLKYSDAMEVAAKLGNEKAIEIQKHLFETDCYAWRDLVKTDDHLPTTYKEIEILFTETIPKGTQFCKFKPLESFYMDVWHIYRILIAPGIISNIRYDQMKNLIYERFDKHDIEEDPMRVERYFIYTLILWHQYDIEYSYKAAYSKSNLLLGEKARPVKSKGYIHFLYDGSEDFIFRSLWHQILFVTVNIFNKQFYPEWK